MSAGLRWTKEQLASHPKRESLLKEASVPEEPSSRPRWVRKTFSFALRCDPMGKPRMTQRDKWQKRPVVIRYRDFCDQVRAAAARRGFDPEWNCFGIKIRAHIQIKPSWSTKKKKRLIGKIARSKPDFDNIIKGVCDALFKEDAVLGGGSCWKWWCAPGDQRISVWISYLEKQ